MKKIVSLFLILSVLWMTGVQAAGFPVQQGLVTDEAGMLTSREAAAIAEAAADGRYTFHVLTIDSLDGANATDFASNVYDSWGLSPQDILLLISAGDQQVELNFINASLQNAINGWSQNQGGGTGSAAITAIVDAYFIASAREGDFAGGISALITELQSLGSTQGSGGTGNGSTGGARGSGSTGTGSTSGGVDGPGGSGSPGAGSGTASRSSGLPLLTLGAIAAGAALLALVLYVLVTGQRRRKQLSVLQDQLSDLLVRTNRAIETLQPFQGIVQGKTGEMVAGISKRLDAQLVEISVLQGTGRSPQPAFYQLAALKSAIGQAEQTAAGFRTRIEDEERQIALITDADRNVKQQITELKKDAPELDTQLQEAVKDTGYELQEIAEDLKELAEATAKADQLELFDPIAAQDITEEAQEQQEQIEQDLRDVDVYDDKLQGFPGVLAAARTKIAGIIEQNALHNMKVKPYDNLDQARSAAETLQAPLRSGDMDQVRSIAATMDLLVQEAVAMTERQAQIRQSNHRDLETVRSGWSGLQSRLSGLQSRLAEARTRFAEQHLASIAEVLDSSGARLREGPGEMPQIETWTSDERGEYDNARSGLDRLLTLQEETAKQFSSVSQSLDELNARLEGVKRLFQEGLGRADSAQRLLASRGLAGRSRFQASLLPEYGQLESRLSLRPYNLDELESLGRSYAAQISSFVEEANRLVRQKEEAERQAQLAMMRERQRREQARKRMSSGPPSSGGFGGGRSSGGSSWGGGGRSSGGSSWGGGKSGRNSGGSKW
ncbi:MULTISPECIES: TPM domain-containing protein [unclassified Paenibacillus]|uniref:TPM domain-containing protein n=1 Tax=unclassified Paenibacillus TaxID=185978 RepID=UPI00240670C4|nr:MULTISPECIES: TPM domain-containing protein [unclassified Paenibacillus]MDF9840901.1 septation ring formation regulator EzrA [Paenibacillus sp. PastF-2]MDF9847485.1 septation ring formation regulator EzrA [Paenibacillus sp. PastM-2]MDF9853938.1 septation ring formation regulator EzrA [Paenibacillus sp. PastF-1]MDH6479210.1 septation ring formation regulator EzrA [Paenibacillus sp. PastH-2]MDH6507054.1 septation ring formation regulator EzrA [Paenibacillus sp. PastM-3]